MIFNSYTRDISLEIDKPEELIADEIGISLCQAREVLKLIDAARRESQAEALGRCLGLILEVKNTRLMVYALSVVAGLDQLNGLKTQTEMAEELGMTRSALSDAVMVARDALCGNQVSLESFAFRKSNEAREIYKSNANQKRKKLLKLKEEIKCQQISSPGQSLTELLFQRMAK